jgi:hypothetical protein
MRRFVLLAIVSASVMMAPAASASSLIARLGVKGAPTSACTGAADTCRSRDTRIAQSCPAGYKLCTTPLGKTCCARLNDVCVCY